MKGRILNKCFPSSCIPDIISEPHPLYQASNLYSDMFQPIPDLIQHTQLQAMVHFTKDFMLWEKRGRGVVMLLEAKNHQWECAVSYKAIVMLQTTHK